MLRPKIAEQVVMTTLDGKSKSTTDAYCQSTLINSMLWLIGNWNNERSGPQPVGLAWHRLQVYRGHKEKAIGTIYVTAREPVHCPLQHVQKGVGGGVGAGWWVWVDENEAFYIGPDWILGGSKVDFDPKGNVASCQTARHAGLWNKIQNSNFQQKEIPVSVLKF